MKAMMIQIHILFTQWLSVTNQIKEQHFTPSGMKAMYKVQIKNRCNSSEVGLLIKGRSTPPPLGVSTVNPLDFVECVVAASRCILCYLPFHFNKYLSVCIMRTHPPYWDCTQISRFVVHKNVQISSDYTTTLQEKHNLPYNKSALLSHSTSLDKVERPNVAGLDV